MAQRPLKMYWRAVSVPITSQVIAASVGPWVSYDGIKE
jgi:hypothetical protein